MSTRKELHSMTNEELVTAIQAGDGSLMGQLWEQCYKFIRLQATRFLHEWDGNTGFELDDLTHGSLWRSRQPLEKRQDAGQRHSGTSR